MAIAIIGWGSLIWSPGSLVLGSRWFKDGPTLPLEFARISNRDRATLVISEFGSPQRTYWVYASSDNPDSVVSELGRREGTRRIDFTLSDGTVSQGCSVQTGSSMSQWLGGHPELHGCVWTGLGSNWIEKRGQAFSVEDALKYLTELPDASEAKEYIQKAPAQIQTPLRRRFAKSSDGWMLTSQTIFSPGHRLKEAFRFLLGQIELPDFDLRTDQMTVAFDVVAG